jgi:hypothetical protein
MFLMYVLMCDLLYGLQELGCSANEKSLERYLGEAQKKHFKHTNARDRIPAITSDE